MAKSSHREQTPKLVASYKKIFLGGGGADFSSRDYAVDDNISAPPPAP